MSQAGHSVGLYEGDTGGSVPKVITTKFLKVDRAIQEFRSRLEDQMFEDHDGHPEVTTKVYYPLATLAESK